VSSDLCSIYILPNMYLPLLSTSLFFLSYAQAGPALDIQYQANFCNAPEKSIFPNSSVARIEEEHQHAGSCSQHEPPNENIVRTSSYTPWTHKRQCLEDEENYQEYCVYTDANFADGRGISFFTSREIAKRVESLPAFLQQGIHDNANRFVNPPWEIRNILGRGNGLFATRTLYRGDEIIVATPVGVYHSQAFSADRLTGYQYLRKTFDQMPNDTREVILRTAVNEPGDPIMERINTNAFLGDFEGAPHFLLYPETAVRRHSPRHVIPTNSLFSAHEP
jgi:hypothetical protein